MSRKSARLQYKRRRDSTEDEQEIIATFSRKRKAEEELDRSDEVSKRRHQFQIQNQWVPITEQTNVKTCVLVPGGDATAATSPPVTKLPPDLPSPHHDHVTPQNQIINNQNGNCNVSKQPPQTHLPGSATFRFSNYFTTPVSLRHSPLPSLQWADSAEVWQLMLQKEELYIRDSNVLDRHPSLQPKMRAILLDWLIEVCEVYRLHRETFYLAMDFVDRFLSMTRNVQKQQLQLLGISSLFISAKLEEIYPPKLADFAYVTDGACTENEILDQELVMLKALKWDLSPMTPNSWLNVFLQLVNVDKLEEKENSFVFPQYSSHAFIQIARLLDLCSLDIGSLQFTYSVLATSALYHMSSEHVALSVSGYQWMDIAPCVHWMAPHAMTLREVGPIEFKFFREISKENTHNIQTHSVDLQLLEKAQTRQILATSARASPDMTREIPGIITPPASGKGKAKGASSGDEQTPGKETCPSSS